MVDLAYVDFMLTTIGFPQDFLEILIDAGLHDFILLGIFITKHIISMMNILTLEAFLIHCNHMACHEHKRAIRLSIINTRHFPVLPHPSMSSHLSSIVNPRLADSLKWGDTAGSSLLRCSQQQQKFHNMGFFSHYYFTLPKTKDFLCQHVQEPYTMMRGRLCSWISFFFSPSTCHWNTTDRGDMSHGIRIAERGACCITEIRQMNQ